MAKIKKENLIVKLIIALCIILVLSSVLPSTMSYADSEELSFGGVLLKPIVDLIVGLGDIVMDLIHSMMLGVGDSIIRIDLDNGILATIVTIAVGLAVAVVVAVVAYFTAGVAIPALLTAIGTATGVGAAASAATLTAAAAGTIAVASVVAGAKAGIVAGIYVNSEWFGDEAVLTLYQITPQEIFSGKLEVLNANFFSNDSGTEGQKSIAQQLKASISKWYYVLRNIAILLMMSILIYVGIRMMMTSIASEKSKYKNLTQDWIIAFCLMFVMQYIMVFSMNIVQSITDFINDSTQYEEYDAVINDKDKKIEKALKKYQEEHPEQQIWDDSLKDDDDNILWPANNIMGLVRTMTAEVRSGTYAYLAQSLVFVILVWYTIFFLFTYIKRIIYLAFLTVIAPLVAMTYPIDKISDGKAQAFNMWLKEYIFNLLIQPVHLIMYMMLISMSFEFASTNLVYTLVAIGFMMPAEKLLRRFFGFEKAQTPGTLGGAIGAATLMKGLDHVFKRKQHRAGNDYIGKGNEQENNDTNRYVNTSGINDNLLIDDNASKDNDNNEKTPEWGDNDYQDMIQELRNPDVSNEDKEFWRTQLKDAPLDGEGENINRYADDFADPNMSDEDKDMLQENLLARIKIGKHINTIDTSSSESQTNITPDAHQITKKPTVRLAKTPNKSRMRGLKSAGQEIARQKLNGAMKKVSSGKGVEKVGNAITGAFVGAGLGVLGATLGVASGDPTKVAQYGGAGAAGGYALGSRNNSKINASQVNKEYEKGYYGNMDEYKKAQMEKSKKEFIQDDNKMKELQEKMNYKSTKEARNKMKEYQSFLDAGFDNTDDIATMIKMVEEHGWSKNKAMTTAKFSNKLNGRPSKLSKKETEELDYKCKKIAEKNNAPNVDVAIKQIKDNVELFGKTKENMMEIGN